MAQLNHRRDNSSNSPTAHTLHTLFLLLRRPIRIPGASLCSPPTRALAVSVGWLVPLFARYPWARNRLFQLSHGKRLQEPSSCLPPCLPLHSIRITPTRPTQTQCRRKPILTLSTKLLTDLPHRRRRFGQGDGTHFNFY